MTSRKSIPTNLKDKLLVEASHACTICGHSSVQVHHIDGNPSNNAEDNLIVLCLNHHDEAERGKTSKGLSSSLSQSTLLEYKRRLQKSILPDRSEMSSKSSVSADIQDVRDSNIVVSGGDVTLNWTHNTSDNRKNKDKIPRANVDLQHTSDTSGKSESIIEDHISVSGHLKKLRDILTLHFDQEELKDLCFNLDVDYEGLRGEGKGNKARELVTYMRRHGRIQELENEIDKERPHVLRP